MQTLRDYVRNSISCDEFTVAEIFDGYRKIKPSIKPDSVLCQLNRLTEKGELKKVKRGARIWFCCSKSQSKLKQFDRLLNTRKVEGE